MSEFSGVVDIEGHRSAGYAVMLGSAATGVEPVKGLVLEVGSICRTPADEVPTDNVPADKSVCGVDLSEWIVLVVVMASDLAAVRGSALCVRTVDIVVPDCKWLAYRSTGGGVDLHSLGGRADTVWIFMHN